ncbi:SAV_2336 N-terminal domain-related protein [Streptomyces sp. NPDC053367]|uniref:SAV_2336 N-terminal domain-related protein n=1 Tax=Streptomyces sp. NPDC053367 TaxID=3365700 RepID=UPI0037D07A17
MPSDLPDGPGSAGAPGGAEPLVRLAGLLAEASGSGVRPTGRELAELLWLARRMEDVHPASPESPRAEPPRPRPAQPREPAEEPAPPPPPGPGAPGTPPAPEARVPLHLPSPRGGDGPAPRHAALLAPAPPMLRHPLGLQRALRPLKRRTDAPAGHELDERATAERIARLGAAPEWWLPVMRPARERWLRLHLVHDTGPTMPVWRPLVAELHTALAQSGVFRTVTLHRAAPDGTVDGRAAHAPADGRTVTLLISDCMGPQWREGPAATRWYATLRRWSHRMPVALVQPLPEHLWRDTALPAAPGRLSSPYPAAPSSLLAFEPYDGVTEPGLPLPVLEPDPAWLANWASLIASPGGTRYPAAVAALPAGPPDATDLTDLSLLTPEDLVLRFRATASPEAFRLAGHLALGRPDLPVMRLIHAALEPDPRPQHLAEVILSGLLTAAPGPPGSYTFRPGVRELLLRAVPRTSRLRTTDLLERVGGLIDSRAGRAPGEFAATTPAEGGTTGADGEAFATVSPESARQLTGTEPVPAGLADRYRLVRRLTPTGSLWQARDTETGRQVALRLHGPITDPARREAFLRDARRLKKLRHPNVVTVHDIGFDGDTPYVVMEHLDGIPLNSLAAPNGYRLPPPLLVSVGSGLAQALRTVHETGTAHGGLGMSRVVLLPDGTVKLSLFEPGRAPGAEGREADLWALAEMLLQLATDTGSRDRPVDAGTLVRLPARMRRSYAHALNRLMRAEPTGLTLLSDPQLPSLAHDTYAPRRYRVLGPLRVEGAPEPDGTARAMLALLLLRHGHVVTHEELRTGIWAPGQEPGNAMAVLGATASRLRTLLGPDAALATRPDGYALHTSADQVDVVRCDTLVRAAERARLAADLAEAHAHITDALGLWQADALLHDVPGPAARTARTRLLQLHLTLCRTRAELDLDLGEVDRAAGDLAGLVRAHPAREDFRRLYLIALRRQGRTAEALEVFEEYELSGGRSPELLELGRELREEAGPAPSPAAPALSLTTTPLTGRPEARIKLEYAVHETLARGALTPQQYEVTVREDGYDVRTEPGADLLPVLVAALRTVPEALAALRDPPQVGVRFQDAPQPSGRAPLTVAVPPALYERFAASSAARGPQRFLPWYDDVDAGPLSWYCPLSQSGDAPGGTRDLVSGPHIVRDPRELGVPEAGRSARVHAPSDGPLALLDPARSRVTTYYEVDLTPHTAARQLRLPSSGKDGFTAAVELSWHVTDPVAFVHGGPARVLPRLLERLTEAAGRVTRHRSPRHAAGAERAVNAVVRDWPVPGLAVSYSVRLTPGRAPAPPRRTAASRTLPELLAAAQTVLLGFDGPLARLYSAQSAREAALDLLSVAAEHRDPRAAEAGRPFGRGAGEAREVFPHPLDVLRLLAREPFAPVLRARLDELELRAVPEAPATYRFAALIRALHEAGRPVEVVSDVCERAVHRYLEPYGLPPVGVYGRDDDLTRLMPDPSCLLRALHRPGRPTPAGLLITASPAEVTAALRIGLPCVGLARSPTTEQRLLEAGCETTVPSLEPVLQAARAL